MSEGASKCYLHYGYNKWGELCKRPFKATKRDIEKYPQGSTSNSIELSLFEKERINAKAKCVNDHAKGSSIDAQICATRAETDLVTQGLRNCIEEIKATNNENRKIVEQGKNSVVAISRVFTESVLKQQLIG